MTFRTPLRLPLAFAALLGCLATTPAAAQDAPAPPAACFPAAIEGFETAVHTEEQVARLKSHRNTTAAGYNAAAYRTTITMFVNDREPGADDAREGEAAIAEALAAHPGSELAMGGEGTVPLAGVATPARGGFLVWSEGETGFGSFLWVVPRHGHYVKIRATYVRPAGDREVVAAMQFAASALETVARGTCDPG